MVFSSLIFLWLFLPIIIILYYIVQDGFKNICLSIASLIFYAWGEPKYIVLMIYSVFINYVIGILMERFKRYKTVLLVLSLKS